MNIFIHKTIIVLDYYKEKDVNYRSFLFVLKDISWERITQV